MSAPARPVEGRFLSTPIKIMLVLWALGTVAGLWRFTQGLGAATAMNDGYPWGLWIAFDVVVGTGLASGGYAMALLVFVFNKGRYHPLVRPALVTSFLGYSVAGVAVAAPSPCVNRHRPATVPSPQRTSISLIAGERNLPSTGRAGALIAAPPSWPSGRSSR